MTNSMKTLLAGAALAGLLTGTGARLQAQDFDLNSGKAGVKAVQQDGGDKDKTDKHACRGQNSCKGKGGCKSGDNGCKGENSCKGTRLSTSRSFPTLITELSNVSNFGVDAGASHSPGVSNEMSTVTGQHQWKGF